MDFLPLPILFPSNLLFIDTGYLSGNPYLKFSNYILMIITILLFGYILFDAWMTIYEEMQIKEIKNNLDEWNKLFQEEEFELID